MVRGVFSKLVCTKGKWKWLAHSGRAQLSPSTVTLWVTTFQEVGGCAQASVLLIQMFRPSVLLRIILSSVDYVKIGKSNSTLWFYLYRREEDAQYSRYIPSECVH